MRPARWLTACALSCSPRPRRPARVAAGAAPSGDTLGVYVGTLDAAQLENCARPASTMTRASCPPAAGGKVAVETILGHASGASAHRGGRTADREARRPRRCEAAAAAPTVFRPYNAPGGMRDELAATAARHPSWPSWSRSARRCGACRSRPSR